ncbi:hypothetical protein L198_07466 [Cryptococcus wingfieldii CBS 7118]|uniref:Uncharacterized protein n=1 Tax=Cryptococcus wingfieldii CBS 7118 TaxID=1295528 RepID=A0A1E3IBQ9_9TREE|nr:hypothetical protein L198_07466 [Cryptococcus wingfieldii CBS 7118]ODN85898.1 hypothetical protein L198_07466 [Cryptococcus wingfieldii CBS 7118]
MEDTRAFLDTFSETSSHTSSSNDDFVIANGRPPQDEFELEDEYRSDAGLTGYFPLEDDIQQLTAQGTNAIMTQMNHLLYEERVRMAPGYTVLESAVTIPAGDSPPADTQQHLDNDDAASIDDSGPFDPYDEVEFDEQASSSEEEDY